MENQLYFKIYFRTKNNWSYIFSAAVPSSATLLNIFSSKLYYQQMMEEEEKVKKSDLSETLRILNENEDILNVGLEFYFLNF